MHTNEEAFHELSFYTLSHPTAGHPTGGKGTFIHQHVVDAQAAQMATEKTKPIQLVFALVGLYLFLEKGKTGIEVQNFHLRMSQKKQEWPLIELPGRRGEVTAVHVLAAPAGDQRDDKIKTWCQSVWEAYQPSRDIIVKLVESYIKPYEPF